MIRFILNDQLVETEVSPGLRTLDFIRENWNLKGTKEGCREGDCGACTILVGEKQNNFIYYRAVTSCLLPLAEVDGRHVITIEGLNKKNLNQIQQFILEERASQCGFCTPGIILSLTGFFLNAKNLSLEESLKALDGNVCRCTGYSSIKRVTSLIQKKYSGIKQDLLDADNKFKTLVDWNILPDYFLNINTMMDKLETNNQRTEFGTGFIRVAGGTDLYVQNEDELEDENIQFLKKGNHTNKIFIKDEYCYIGATVTVDEIYSSNLLEEIVPEIKKKFHLISSTPIRNMATLGGNLVNASPIGDLSIFFLALNSEIALSGFGGERVIKLHEFFIDYKKLNKTEDELVSWIRFKVPEERSKINFEKVSKRNILDIASVNSAMQIRLREKSVEYISLSAGGISPVPKFFFNSKDFLTGREISADNIKAFTEACIKDISPISDVRGSAEYKTNLLRRLIYAHFINTCGEFISAEELI